MFPVSAETGWFWVLSLVTLATVALSVTVRRVRANSTERSVKPIWLGAIGGLLILVGAGYAGRALWAADLVAQTAINSAGAGAHASFPRLLGTGEALEFEGAHLGDTPGTVLFNGKPGVIAVWSKEHVIAKVPPDLKPGIPITVELKGAKGEPIRLASEQLQLEAPVSATAGGPGSTGGSAPTTGDTGGATGETTGSPDGGSTGATEPPSISRPAQITPSGPLISAALFLAMLLGITAKWLWDALESRRGRRKLRLDGYSLLQPFLVSPIVFGGVIAITHVTLDVAGALLAFQNGFFWQTVFATIAARQQSRTDEEPHAVILAEAEPAEATT